jgi:hypothetical protein
MLNSAPLKDIPVGAWFQPFYGEPECRKISDTHYEEVKFPHRIFKIKEGDLCWTSHINGMQEVDYSDLEPGDEFQHNPWYSGDAAVKMHNGYKRINCGGVYYGKSGTVYIKPKTKGENMQVLLKSLSAGDKFKIPGFSGVYAKLSSEVQKSFVNLSEVGKRKEYYYDVNNNILYACDDKLVELVESAKFKQVKFSDLTVGDKYYSGSLEIPKTKVSVLQNGVLKSAFIVANQVTVVSDTAIHNLVLVEK